MQRFWSFVWPDNVANIAAVTLAVFAAGFGLFNIVDEKKLAALTLATLGLIAYSLIRDRVSRDALTAGLKTLIETNRLIPADRFFKMQTDEADVLRSANQSAFLVQETGALVAERCQDEIIKILQGGGAVKIVVCLPLVRPAATLAYRNENLDKASAILGRLDGFQNQINFICRKVGPYAASLQIRYTPYDVGYTAILTNVASRFAEKKGLVRIAGFRVPYAKKLDFTFDSRQSPSTMERFADEFANLFMSSTKIVLLTAEPRFGKTTMFEEMLRVKHDASDVFYAVSARSGEDPEVFSVKSSVNDSIVEFARKVRHDKYMEKDIRQYDIDVGVWDEVARQIGQARKQRKVLVVDEIGLMQLKSESFKKEIQEILSDSSICLFATVGLEDDPDSFIRLCKENPRSTVFEARKENKEEIQKLLREEFSSALTLHNYMVSNG